MDVENRAFTAIQLTRILLNQALDKPETMMLMAAWDVEPDALEDTVALILEYLDKTRGEAKSDGQ